MEQEFGGIFGIRWDSFMVLMPFIKHWIEKQLYITAIFDWVLTSLCW